MQARCGRQLPRMGNVVRGSQRPQRESRAAAPTKPESEPMTHLSSFKAVRYRGIDGLSLPHLSQANLVTGVNGIGKTALLEAMWLFVGRYSPTLLWNANVQRSTNPVLDPVSRLSNGGLELHGGQNGSTHQLKTVFEKVAEVATPATAREATERNMMQLPVAGRIETYLDGQLVKGDFGGARPTPWGVVVHQTPVPPKPQPSCVIESTKFQLETPGEYLQRYSDMVRANQKEELTNAINLLLPRVKDLEILTDRTGESYLSALTKCGVQLPLHDLGGGIIRLYRLLLSLFTCRDGIMLVDELENGIHYSGLNEVWTRARQWMRRWNVQLVATTHSAECIEAAMAAFADSPEDLSIHKLFVSETTGAVEAVTFTGETLEGARDLNLEVR